MSDFLIKSIKQLYQQNIKKTNSKRLSYISYNFIIVILEQRLSLKKVAKKYIGSDN